MRSGAAQCAVCYTSTNHSAYDKYGERRGVWYVAKQKASASLYKLLRKHTCSLVILEVINTYTLTKNQSM